MKRVGKILIKTLLLIIFAGFLGLSFFTGQFKDPGNPLSHKRLSQPEEFITKTFTFSETITPDPQDILDAIPEFVDVPEGGTSWTVFGETKQHEYTYMDEGDMEWTGVRPEFSENIKPLDGQTIKIQGYMFPLSQEEKQPMFLLGPFPVSCPYHYHVPPKLIIEVHAKSPVEFSYDAVDIKGTLELVFKDDEYNIFYRLKDAELLNEE